MKILKFATQLIPSLLSGEKTSTWRLFDDKELSLGDDLEFRNSENGAIIGYGKIISLEEKKISEMKEEDCDGHEQCKNTEEIITNLKKYYGNNIDEDSIVKIIHFSFKKIYIMKFILVAAMTCDRVIGKNNQLPWDIPEEMADFRAFTSGKTILMGRKTYEGLGRILPKRRNILLTRDPSVVKIGDFQTVEKDGQWIVDGGEKGQIEIYTSIEEVQKNLASDEDLLVLGGAEIYKLFLDNPLSEIRLSEIHGDYEGDTYFPAFEELYIETSREPKEGYDLVWYKRKI